MSSLSSGEKKHRLNALDFLLIILIVGAIAAAIVIVVRSNPNIISGGDKTALCTVTATALPESLKELVKVGDLIYDSESSQLLGKVTEVKAEPYKLNGTNELTGATATTEVEGKITLTVTFEALTSAFFA